MPIDPRILAQAMQRMPATNAPVPPGPPPPGQFGAPQQSPGMPVQMQGTMMMKPVTPPQPQQGGAPMPPGGGQPMPPRNF